MELTKNTLKNLLALLYLKYIAPSNTSVSYVFWRKKFKKLSTVAMTVCLVYLSQVSIVYLPKKRQLYNRYITLKFYSNMRVK